MINSSSPAWYARYNAEHSAASLTHSSQRGLAYLKVGYSSNPATSSTLQTWPYARVDRRVTRTTENHAAAVALYFMYCNFGRVHQALRVTAAMEAGVSNHVWSIEEIVGLLD